MTTPINPIPNHPIGETHEWRDWFFRLYKYTTETGSQAFNGLSFLGSNITSIVTRNHNDLTLIQGGDSLNRYHLTSAEYAVAVANNHNSTNGLQGGTTGQYYHLTSAQYSALTTSQVKNYGAWHDLTTQTATLSTALYPVQIGGVLDYVSNFSIVTGVNGPTQITAVNAGLYNFQYSLQLNNPTASISNATVWWRRNGVDLINTASTMGIMAKHGSINGLSILSMNVFLQLAAGDNVEMFWQSDVAGCQIITLPAGISPALPVSPGVIVTVLEVK